MRAPLALERDFYGGPARQIRIGNNGADDTERNSARDPDAPARLQGRIAFSRIRNPAAYDQVLADREQREIEEADATWPNGEARPGRQFDVDGYDLETLGLIRV